MRLQRNERRAFTLVEVILAVFIASGLLIVAISFYQRSADLRRQLLEESERLTTIRLIMDRMSADLRTAFAEPRQGFTGGPDFMKFVHAGSPSPGKLIDGAMQMVTYSVVTNAEGTNTVVIGFDRNEAPLVELRSVSTNREAISFHGEMDFASMTNRVPEPLTRAIRFVQFRYFSGSEWLQNWNGVDLPLGVEVILGTDPMLPEDELYSNEQFRRVIYVPAGRVAEVWEEFP